MALLFGYCRMEEIIAEFVSRYLAEAAKHTQIKDFHSLPHLYSRFAVHHLDSEGKIDDSEGSLVDGREALLDDLTELDKPVAQGDSRLNINTQHPDYSSLAQTFRPDSGGIRNLKKIRQLLIDDETVQVIGSKRGATYGNINARPTLTDSTIAHLIRVILKTNPGSHRWTDLCTPVLTMIRDIHFQGVTIADTNRDLIFSANKPSKTSESDFIRQDRDPSSLPPSSQSDISVKFRVNIPQIGQQEQTHSIYGSTRWHAAVWLGNPKETDEQLELWIDVNYSEDWFFKSTSNIQRLLKRIEDDPVIAGTGSNGTKRGYWMHVDQVAELSRGLNANFVPELITQNVGNIDGFIHSADTNDPREKHHLEQLKGDLSFLIDEIERCLQNQIEING